MRSPAPRALVTGGAGFIGSHLCEGLLGRGYEVDALDDLSTGRRENVEHLLDHQGFRLVIDSVLDEAVVNSLVHRADLVWHLAAAVGVRLVVERPVHTLMTNLRGTEVVLDLCARFGKRVLVVSTSEVYGDHRSKRPLAESDQRIYGPTTVNRWGYAGSKAIDEFLTLAYVQERELDGVVARLFNTAGPRQTGEYGMVVPSFVSSALAGEPLRVHGDGEQTRCFCHVGDTVEALVGLLEDSQTTGEIFNVGNDTPMSIMELAERVVAMAESTSSIQIVSYETAYGPGFEDMRHRVPDISKIGAQLGWQPERDLDTMLADVIVDISQRADMAQRGQGR